MASRILQVVILLVCTNSKVIFKDYDPKQNLLLPPSLDELWNYTQEVAKGELKDQKTAPLKKISERKKGLSF